MSGDSTNLVKEYGNSRYAVWTTARKGSRPSDREVVITGNGNGVSQSSLARKIGEEFGDWLNRVQVIKRKGQQRFVAWVTVKGDRIYDFVELFNKERRIGNSTAAPKRSVDCTRKVVVHGMKNMSVDDIKKLLGPEKVASVLKKRDTAFVVMGDETYAQAVLSGENKVKATVTRYVERPHDPLKAVNKRLTKMYEELLTVVDGLRRQVTELTKELAKTKGREGNKTVPIPEQKVAQRTAPDLMEAEEQRSATPLPAVPVAQLSAENQQILEQVNATSPVFARVKKEIAALALASARKRYGLTEDEPVIVDVDDDSEKEIQSPQLNDNKKRSARITLGDLMSNKAQDKKKTTDGSVSIGGPTTRLRSLMKGINQNTHLSDSSNL